MVQQIAIADSSLCGLGEHVPIAIQYFPPDVMMSLKNDVS